MGSWIERLAQVRTGSVSGRLPQRADSLVDPREYILLVNAREVRDLLRPVRVTNLRVHLLTGGDPRFGVSSCGGNELRSVR